MAFRRDLIGGIVVVAPVVLVLYVVYWVVSHLSIVPVPLGFTGRPAVDAAIRVLLAGLAVVAVLVLIGRGTRTLLGERIETWFDRQMNRIPAVRMIYNASKVALEMALQDTQEYQKPVRVEIADGISVPGFKTGTEVVEGKETVFVPTSPNITTGMILYLDPERTVDFEGSTEEALTHVLSAGFLETGEQGEVESALQKLLEGK